MEYGKYFKEDQAMVSRWLTAAFRISAVLAMALIVIPVVVVVLTPISVLIVSVAYAYAGVGWAVVGFAMLVGVLWLRDQTGNRPDYIKGFGKRGDGYRGQTMHVHFDPYDPDGTNQVER